MLIGLSVDVDACVRNSWHLISVAVVLPGYSVEGLVHLNLALHLILSLYSLLGALLRVFIGLLLFDRVILLGKKENMRCCFRKIFSDAVDPSSFLLSSLLRVDRLVLK